MFEFGLVLQIVGVLITFISQAMFWYRTYKKYGCVQKAFLDMAGARFAFDDKQLKELPKDEVKKCIRDFPLAKWLYENFKYSVIGATFTLIGVSLSLVNMSYSVSSIYSVLCLIFIFGVFGILVSIYYFRGDRIEDSKACKKKEQQTLKYKGNEDLFKFQYEQISQDIRSRDNVTNIVGTILVTASVLLLSSCVGLLSPIIKLPIVLVSLAIYAIWLIGLELTATKLNNLDLSRLRKMEGDDDFPINIHTYRLGKVGDEIWFKYFRRKIWLWLLWVLIGLGIAILSIPT